MAELATMLGDVGARNLHTACARLPVGPGTGQPGRIVTDPVVRERIAAVRSTLRAEPADQRRGLTGISMAAGGTINTWERSIRASTSR